VNKTGRDKFFAVKGVGAFENEEIRADRLSDDAKEVLRRLFQARNFKPIIQI